MFNFFIPNRDATILGWRHTGSGSSKSVAVTDIDRRRNSLLPTDSCDCSRVTDIDRRRVSRSQPRFKPLPIVLMLALLVAVPLPPAATTDYGLEITDTKEYGIIANSDASHDSVTGSNLNATGRVINPVKVSSKHVTHSLQIGEAFILKKIVSFAKIIPFQSARKLIQNVKLNLLELNDGNVSEAYTAKDNKMFLSNWQSSPLQAERMCKEMGGIKASIRDLVSEKIVLRHDIITSDRFEVNRGTLTCQLDSSELKGVACIRNLKTICAALNKPFKSHSSSIDLFNKIVSAAEHATLYVLISSNSSDLVEYPHAHSYCKLHSQGSSIFRNSQNVLVKSKFYSHTRALYANIVSTFELDIDNLQRVAALAVTNAALSPHKVVPDLCEKIVSQYLFPVHDTMIPSVPSHLDTFLAHNKDQLELAYEVYTNVTAEECNTLPIPYKKKLYAESVILRDHTRAVLMTVASITDVLSTNWTLNFGKTNSRVVTAAIQSITGKRLSETELSSIVVSLHNAKVRMLMNLCRFLETKCPPLQILEVNDLIEYMEQATIRKSFSRRAPEYQTAANTLDNSSRRSKRWVWTPFLAGISGLAKETEIKILTKDAKNMLKVERETADEIVRIENTNNHIIDKVNMQNEKFIELFRDEKDLNTKLSDLLKDDASVQLQLSLLVKNMEAISDVQTEYLVIQTIIDMIPTLMLECRTLITDLVTDSVSAEIAARIADSGLFFMPSLQNIQTNILNFDGNFSVIYEVPVFFPKY